MKKYCFTLFSVGDLKRVNDFYGGFTLKNISIFEKNAHVRECMDRSIVDTIYVYSQLVSSEEEYGGILSGNLYVTNNGLYSIDCSGDFLRIENNSELYIFRVGSISKTFYHFLKVYSKKAWDIDIILPFGDACENILSSKVHGIYYYDDPKRYIPSIIPAIDKKEDISYLARFIQKSGVFKNRIILKKDGFWGGNGIDILDIRNSEFSSKLKESIGGFLDKDFIIMDLLDTTDVEYRVYWSKINGIAHVIDIHGKKRKEGHILHNIAQGNKLIRLGKDTIQKKLIDDIEDFCTKLPELHGGLDVITSIDGSYFCTENNAMTGYLYEEAEEYLAKDWLNAIANCYKK